MLLRNRASAILLLAVYVFAALKQCEWRRGYNKSDSKEPLSLLFDSAGISALLKFGLRNKFALGATYHYAGLVVVFRAFLACGLGIGLVCLLSGATSCCVTGMANVPLRLLRYLALIILN